MLKELDIVIPKYTPNYILDEIEIYINKKRKEKIGIATFDNILSLIRLSLLNNRISEEQAKELKEIVNKLKQYRDIKILF